MSFLETMDFEMIPAVFTGDKEKDDESNTKLYLELVNKGKKEGYCPVLVDKSIEHYKSGPTYGCDESKEGYYKLASMLKREVNGTCFSVWMGRFAYNYYLDCCEYEEDFYCDMDNLTPPTEQRYEARFSTNIQIRELNLGRNRNYKSWKFSYENQVFALVPVTEPWEVLAYIPMGGFNWCPDSLHQVALSKMLYELFGARIMYISFATIEYYIEKPIVDKETFEKIARLLIVSDNDIYEDYEVTADMILGSQNLCMWWD